MKESIFLYTLESDSCLLNSFFAYTRPFFRTLIISPWIWPLLART